MEDTRMVVRLQRTTVILMSLHMATLMTLRMATLMTRHRMVTLMQRNNAVIASIITLIRMAIRMTARKKKPFNSIRTTTKSRIVTLIRTLTRTTAIPIYISGPTLLVRTLWIHRISDSSRPKADSFACSIRLVLIHRCPSRLLHQPRCLSRRLPPPIRSPTTHIFKPITQRHTRMIIHTRTKAIRTTCAVCSST